jgi:hypothetical protein
VRARTRESEENKVIDDLALPAQTVPSIILPPPTIPAIQSLAPPTAALGSDSVALTVTGTNFNSGAHVQVRPVGSTTAPTAIATTYVSSTTLRATLPRSILQSAVILEVTVQNSNLLTSSPFDLSVQYPNIATISPAAVQANTPATLTLSAVDIYVFADGSRKSGVQIDGTTLSTSQVTVAIDPSHPDRGTITAQVPAALLGPGQHAVRLVNPTDSGPVSGGQAAITASVTSGTMPAITGLSPSSGPVGIDVVISGRNFSGATAVRFTGGQLADHSIDGSGMITAEVPAGAASGPVTVVTPAGSAVSPVAFSLTVATNPPMITSIQPAQGMAGDVVKILGRNLSDVRAIRFGVIPGVSLGIKATMVTLVSSTEIDVIVPGGAVSGLIRVKTGMGRADSPIPFLIAPKTGTLAAFAPPLGLLGDLVELTGTGLGRAVAVHFNGVAAPFLINSDQSITTFVPIRNTLSNQTVRIDVLAPDSTFGKDGFTVQQTPPNGVFQITGFDPDRAGQGGMVTLYGALQNASDVEISGQSAPVTSIGQDGLTLRLQVPAGAVAGPISARNDLMGLVAESQGDFIPNGPNGLPAGGQPAIDSFTPRLGGPGTPVTIHGVNLAGNIFQLQFGGIPARFSFDAQDPNTLHTTVPGRAPGAAPITIIPSTNGIPVTSARPFVVS